MEMDDIHFRKVGVDDYDEVMSIRGGIYDGLDYLPALYRTMLTNHIGYAATHAGKLIAFECVTFVDNGETMVTRALRVSKEYEGRGLVKKLKEFIEHDTKGIEKLKRKAYTFENKRLLGRVKDGRAKLILRKSLDFFQGNVIDVSENLLLDMGKRVDILQPSDLKDIFKSQELSGELFQHGRLVADWVPYRLTDANVDHFFNEYCHVVWNGHEKDTSVKDLLLTVGISYLTDAGVRYSLDVYGDITEDLFSCHIAEHLKHSLRLKCDMINLCVFYVKNINNEKIITKILEQFCMFKSDMCTLGDLFCVEEPIRSGHLNQDIPR